jgi:hypothetical protein
MKIKIFKVKKDYKKEDFRVNSSAFWKFIVIFSLLLIMGAFAYSYGLFLRINEEEVLKIEVNNDKIGNKEAEKIKNALDYFSEREKKSIEILNSTPAVVDPSL